jgi:hypothetical protein
MFRSQAIFKHRDRLSGDVAEWRLCRNHFPTNNHIGYLIRVMQAAV